jgi:hypothetical protein
MSWRKKYRVVRIVPGNIIAPWGEKIDLSNPNIPEEKIEKLMSAGCPYIQLVEKKLEKPVVFKKSETEINPKVDENQPKVEEVKPYFNTGKNKKKS